MDFLLENLIFAALAVVSGGLLLWNNLRGDGGGVSPQDAVHLFNRQHGMALDVRDSGAFGTGHLIGARNIPADKLESRLIELEKFKNRPIIVYGAGAGKAVALLKRNGFAGAAELTGGIDAWTEAGMPVEK